MRSLPASHAEPYYRTAIHPALNGFADEFCGTLARLFAYVGTLALLGILGLHLWDQLRLEEAPQPAAATGWSVASRGYPAFAVSQSDSPEKTEVYEIFRHPEGGRKDILRWVGPGGRAVAELEIYRPGGEFGQSGSAFADLASRMNPASAHELETAGAIDSQFGPVMLLRLAGSAEDTRHCLGFIKRLSDPTLRISGWSCEGGTLPARRAAIGCFLSHLRLHTAGNEPEPAELFAHAELRRGICTATSTSVDWVTDAENPPLRGTL